MGMAFNAILLVMLVAWLKVAAGEVYKVGDSAGWSDIGPPYYKNWAATKTFRVEFDYNKEIQNVVRVTHKNFRACNTTAPYAIYATGDDSFTIRRTGHYYFICGYPGRCEKGQKVDIRVPATASPPKAPIAPITPLPFPPSPAPSPAPPSIPVPSPAPPLVPVPSPAPPKAPVPSPAPPKAPVSSPAPPKVPVPSPAPPKVPVPSPAPPKVPVPSPAPPSVPVPSPPAPPSVPVQPPTQSPSPSSDLAPAPSPRKNGSSQDSVKIWLTLVAIVIGVLGLAF